MNALSSSFDAQIFRLTAAGDQELRGSMTRLTPTLLELLVRMDGLLTLGEIRQAMPQLEGAGFAAAVAALHARGLVQQAQPDEFERTCGLQLRMLTAMATQPPASAPRRGTFSVGLTWRRAQAAPRRLGATPRAVVVEDDPVLARFIECFLALEGFQVTPAADRAEVVAAMRNPQLPDVVLLDVTLPDVDGFDVLRKLRQHAVLREVPVIMLTGRATRDAVLEALAAGADGYLTKPFEADALTEAVRAVTGIGAKPGTRLQPLPWSNPDAQSTRERLAA